MTGHSIKDIAAALGRRPWAPPIFVVTRRGRTRAAGPDDLALAMSDRYAADLAQGRARAAVLGPGMDWQALGLGPRSSRRDPRYAMAARHRGDGSRARHRAGHTSLRRDRPVRRYRRQARPSAPSSISGRRPIGTQRAHRAPMSASPRMREIGDDALILAGVRIGARFGSAIASSSSPAPFWAATGFPSSRPSSPMWKPRARASARPTTPPRARKAGRASIRWAASLIGDDVEIGANAAIDRGTIADTVIGDGHQDR
jgi:UDP-3-O-[3-hydroxymyristoyl] glucosamine N-acyltransferase